MHRWSLLDSAKQRRCELLSDAAHMRLVARSRARRGRPVRARKRVARVLLAVGYFFLDAGHSLQSEERRSA